MTDAAAPSTTPTPGKPVRVFIADDHRVTVWGLQKLVEAAAPRFALAGVAVTQDELLNHPALADTDVLLLDLDLGGGANGADAIAELQQRCPGRILVLTAADDPAAHRDAVLKGARGVLHKSEPADTVMRAIEKVHGGEVWLHRSLMGDVLGTLTGPGAAAATLGRLTPEAARIASLTPREREIVGVMVRSAGAKQLAIAEELGMSEHTLRNHLTTIYSKLGVRGRLELHVYATEHKLGQPAPPRVAGR